MNENKYFSFSELEEIIENEKVDSYYKYYFENLLEAIVDWPSSNTNEPNEFILELKKEINVVLTFNIIAKFLKTLSLNNDAWKIESLTSLLKLYDFKLENKSNKEIELESIIEQLTIYSRKLIK